MGAPTSRQSTASRFLVCPERPRRVSASNVSMAPQQEPRVIDGARDAGAGSGQGCVFFVAPFYCEP